MTNETAVYAAHEHLLSLAQYAAASLRDIAGWHVLYAPFSNIVCFRREHAAGADANAVSQAIVECINASREYSIGHTFISDDLYVRLCFMNPRTSYRDIDHLLKAINGMACLAESALVGAESRCSKAS
ncbi:hypothetical protein CAI21_06770 [Alkalilimnicola ehrlichii]|uniref:Uncharacterized protein n=2 Tax=Alkalilimnicola ehrlichii TaxID=351052 RepID=A0A3E0X0V8_9GAMM|nr:hypothetical protein CAI21_06770 [Alkalilimnicola ehrlichii]RFA37885.1 hypothetical protein CAL65_08120 [Alkalilimnicola ehrlichii]